MENKTRQKLKEYIRNEIRNELLSELMQINKKYTKKHKRLKEQTQVLPSQKDAENIELMSTDVTKIRTILAALYKDALVAQKENENPSAFMDAYTKLLLSMLPIVGALGNVQMLAGALKAGKLPLGNNSEFKLGSSLTAPKKTPPPPPPLPPKVTVPPKNKLPPVPPLPSKKGVPPPPPPPPPKR